MKNVDLLIFDLDGTLVDTRQDIIVSVNVMLEKFGLPPKSDEEIISYVGVGRDFLVKAALGEENTALFDEAMPFFCEYQHTHEVEQAQLFPGVKDMLEHFSGKKKIILSNRQIDSVHAILRHFAIDVLFDKVMGDDGSGCVKPLACPIEKIAVEFPVQKTACMMIGDMDLDIIAGKAAGIMTCGVTCGLGTRQALMATGPDHLIETIEELKRIIC